jgi:hypothetical protein
LTNGAEPSAGKPAGERARPLGEQLADLARGVVALAGPNAREVTKDEIDALWSHEDMTSASAIQPIGPLVDAHPAKRPEQVTLKGRWVTLAPLDAIKHAEALYEGSNGGVARESVWTYLFDGPYRSFDEFRANIEAKSRSVDPLFFAVIDNSSGWAVGYQTFLRIDPPNRVIEVGNIMYTPPMQRTAGA